MIVIRNNVERNVDDILLQKYQTNGYKLLNKKDAPIVQKEKQSLDELKTTELKELAKEKGIEGYSSLNKKELLAVLKDVE